MAVRVALGQFGGPTTVLNASLTGAWAALQDAGAHVWGIVGGSRGLRAGRWVPLLEAPPSWLTTAPGAALGSGREPPNPSSTPALITNLARAGFDGLVLVGGNGTMALGAALQTAARVQGVPLAVAGVPKTIDNDLEGTDHTPGYPSAASFVASAVRDLGDDLASMAGFEDVRLIEVMGRGAGWLAGAGVLARRHPDDLPQVVLIPEVPLDLEAFTEEVARCHARDGVVLVVVAEGVRLAGQGPLGLHGLDAAGGTTVLGGAARALAEHLRQRLGLRVRAESLGFLPRCLRLAQTERDRREALLLGRVAAQALLQGRAGMMAALPPRTPGLPTLDSVLVPLVEVGGRERRLPPEMLSLGPAFTQWLGPLLEIPEHWAPGSLV